MLVEAVARHWILLVAGGTGWKDMWVREVQQCANFVYVDYGLFVLTDPVWLQGAFDTLTGLSDRVGLQKKVRKMVRIICRPCCAAGNQPAEY